jgi:hypothetical protein
MSIPLNFEPLRHLVAVGHAFTAAVVVEANAT